MTQQVYSKKDLTYVLLGSAILGDKLLTITLSNRDRFHLYKYLYTSMKETARNIQGRYDQVKGIARAYGKLSEYKKNKVYTYTQHILTKDQHLEKRSLDQRNCSI